MLSREQSFPEKDDQSIIAKKEMEEYIKEKKEFD